MSETTDVLPFDSYDEDQEPKEVACKYCKQEGLFWEDTEHAWRLTDADGDYHTCNRSKITEL